MSDTLRPLYLELDLHSEQGRALQQSVADRYGRKIVDAARLARRMFLLRSPWAPGLRFVGAETTIHVLDDDGTTLVPMSLSGSGETLEEAFVSCVGEGVDRLAQIEGPDDVTAVAGMAEMADRLWPPLVASVEQALDAQALLRETPLAWMVGRRLDPTGHVEAGRDALLPADWCLRRAPADRRLAPRTALSVGVAAGPTFEFAASRAVLELVERDAASLWWTGGRQGKAIPLDHPGMANIAALVAALRQQAADRALWLLDITTDIGIPVVVALSCGKDGRQLAYGLASRLSLEEAARAAILELFQTELSILLAMVKQAEMGEGHLSATDRSHLERNVAVDANRCLLLHPAGVRSAQQTADAGSRFGTIAGALGRAGIDVALADLTRPGEKIAVIRAVAPALQPMPSDLTTDRLRQALVEFGGGARHTGGIALIA